MIISSRELDDPFQIEPDPIIIICQKYEPDPIRSFPPKNEPDQIIFFFKMIWLICDHFKEISKPLMFTFKNCDRIKYYIFRKI